MAEQEPISDQDQPQPPSLGHSSIHPPSNLNPSDSSSPHSPPRLLHLIRSSSHSALVTIKTTGHRLFPPQRRSFITDTNPFSRNKAILSIALRKGLLVFFSLHAVLSTTLLALALVRRNRSTPHPHHPLSLNARQTIKRQNLISLLLETFRSSSTARLASWLGLYSSLWTLTYSLLRKCQHKYSYWNSFIAGSLCGVSFFAQSKADRKELAPNVLCRGLYSLLVCYPLCHLKYGDTLLFALSNAQTAIGYLLYPNTLPAWYVHWISRVGQLNPRYIELNRQLDRSSLSRNSNIIQTHHRLICRDTQPRTWKNEIKIQNWLNLSNPNSRKGAPCALNHFGHDSCLIANLSSLLGTMVMMAPTYAILHLVPALIFRSKVLRQSPISFIASIIKKTISSALFLGTYASVVQNCFCIPSLLYEKFGIAVRGARFYGLIGFCAGVSLFWEEPKRRGELALYCAPKALYSSWAVLKSKKLVPNIIFGDILVSSIGCGMLMHCFMNRRDRMPKLISGIISQVIDPHTPDRTRKREKKRQQSEPDPSIDPSLALEASTRST